LNVQGKPEDIDICHQNWKDQRGNTRGNLQLGRQWVAVKVRAMTNTFRKAGNSSVHSAGEDDTSESSNDEQNTTTLRV